MSVGELWNVKLEPDRQRGGARASLPVTMSSLHSARHFPRFTNAHSSLSERLFPLHTYPRYPRMTQPPAKSFLSSVGSLFGWHQAPASQPSTTFTTPTYADVCQARALLKTLNIPTELVLQILDYADYYPQHTFVTSPEHPKHAQAKWSNGNVDACLCLDAGIFNNTTADPIRKGGEVPKIKSLTFEIDSHDQGWTSERTQGTYQTSSWLEVSVLRTDGSDVSRVPSPSFVNQHFRDPGQFHDSLRDRDWYLVRKPQGGERDFAWYLQGNKVAAQKGHYSVTWAQDGAEGNEGAGSGEGLLKEVRDGDRLLVWARAQWPGWQCTVDSVRVTVTYGF